MKLIWQSLRIFILMTLLTGVFYPLAVTGISWIAMREKAQGSLILDQGRFVGSELIGQKFESDRYFWSRPSAVDYNTLPSGGSNLGPTSRDLKTKVQERMARLKAANAILEGEANKVSVQSSVGDLNQTKQDLKIPRDLVFASGSGLDPHISLQAARFQIERIARVRRQDVGAVRKLVEDLAEPRQFGILGEPRVNVLKLNRALDEISAR